ncbi:MAG: pseudouridylate synthase [Betaproteobacteria bacterium HGW-Betaproteobacteria-10]|nr:MAG: pseudouridylate synthase [Betaproteobacteria bacterium HGW-Betaproteobacteria-10]
MSDFSHDRKPKQPSSAAAGDDPWAKWRQAEAPVVAVPVAKLTPVAVDRPKRSEIETSRPELQTAVKVAVKVEVPLAPEVRERPTGTLGVNKAAVAPKKVYEKPYKKPSTAANGRSAPASPWAKAAGHVAGRATTPTAARAENRPTPDGVRLSKVMSERAMCSRREADLWIERGWVFVDGERISELGSRIKPDAEITISKEATKDQEKQVTILLNKPVGYVSGQPEPGYIPAVTLITAENQLRQSGNPQFKPWMLRGLAPAGRLDIDSTGLLVLTQDGRVAKKLIGEDSQAEKEYLVRVSGQLIPGGLRLLQFGLELDGKPLKQAWVKQLNEDQLHFILREGKKRQIRRMCEAVGLTVIGLKRVRIGKVKLGDLPIGQWRFLRADESF